MYKRVLLKLSGEALAGEAGSGIDPATVDRVVVQLVELAKKGVQIAIVVGGGNFWRGRQGVAMDKVTADHMGHARDYHERFGVAGCYREKGCADARADRVVHTPTLQNRLYCVKRCGTSSAGVS